MARILFGVPPALGHIHPTIPIALRLRELGHDVAYACHPALKEALGRYNLAMLEDFRWGDRLLRAQELIGRSRSQTWALARAAGFGFARRIFFDGLADGASALAQALQRHRTDVLISDFIFSPGPIAADLAGIPYATSFPSAPFFPGEGVPPYGSGLASGGRRNWRWRLHEAAYRFVRQRFSSCINGARRRLGLARVEEDLFTMSPWLILVYMTGALEYAGVSAPPQAHYVGPCAPPIIASEDDDFPWERLDGRPVVYMSLGTIYTGEVLLFDRAIEAARGADWQLVLTVGPRQDIRRWADAPGDVIVRNWVPQGAILRRARAVISHGGMNTVLEALSAGLPLAVSPANFGQCEIAQRVIEAGAGLRVNLRKTTTETFRATFRQLLDDPALRAGARLLAADFARCDGPAASAGLIERLARERVPIRRPAGGQITVYAAPGGAGSSPSSTEGLLGRGA